MKRELCSCVLLAILCAVSGDVFGATWDGSWDTNQGTIWSVDQDGNGDSSAQVLNMGPHTYCALTYGMSGGFNSACTVGVRGNDWILAARDPKSPDP